MQMRTHQFNFSFLRTQKITLASLLGGVPAIGMLMLLGLCLWIRKRKRELRRHALANGIELDSDGWPVDGNYTITEDLELFRRGPSGGVTPVPVILPQTLPQTQMNVNVESKGTSPPPPYHRPPVMNPPAPSYDADAASTLAHRAQS